jgi:hypothetical protein
MRSRELFALAAYACLCSVCAASLFADEPQTPAAAPPYASETGEQQSFREWFQAACLLLGTSLEEAFRSFGVPQKVSATRGEEPWQDDVVFEYGEGLSLFWYRDRVWQLRFGSDFPARFSDIHMGASREDITAALGAPFHAEDDWLLYHFAGQGCPVRMRLFFGDKGLEDIYIYRSDF